MCPHLHLLTLVLLGALLGACGHEPPQRSVSVTSKKETQTSNVVQSRKVYRLSVIPGGIYSGQELEEARVTDAVVAAHYSDFGRATRSNLPADTLLYVSYRVGDRVFWTAKPHRIPKGEAILTDGSHVARVRCGNRLSLKRQNPISKEKDPTEVMLGELQPPETDFLNAEGKPSLKPPEMDFAVGRGGTGPDVSSFPFLSPNLSIAGPAIASPAAAAGEGGLPSVFAIPRPVR